MYTVEVRRGIAQLVEHRSPKPSVEGSSPSAPAIFAKAKRLVIQAAFLLKLIQEMQRITFFRNITLILTYSCHCKG